MPDLDMADLGEAERSGLHDPSPGRDSRVAQRMARGTQA